MAELRIFQTETEIPAAVREFYGPRDDGTWGPLLGEGIVPPPTDVSTLERTLAAEKEQRRAATEARSAAEAKIREMTEKFKDVDPEAYREQQKRLEEAETQRLIDEGKMEEAFESRYKRRLDDNQNLIETLQTKNAELEANLSNVSSKFNEHRLKGEFRPFVSRYIKDGLQEVALNQLISGWDFDEKDKPVLWEIEGDSKKIVYGPKTEPITPEEFFTDWRAKPEVIDAWVKPSSGASMEHAGRTDANGVVHVSRDDMRNTAQYEKTLAAAEANGQSVVVDG